MLDCRMIRLIVFFCKQQVKIKYEWSIISRREPENPVPSHRDRKLEVDYFFMIFLPSRMYTPAGKELKSPFISIP